MGMLYTVETDFRFRNDDGSETAATWKAASGTNISNDPDEIIRLRFEVRETAGSDFTPGAFEYRLNAGTWTAITTSSSVVKFMDSTHITHDEVTTEQMAGPGTFVSGRMVETASYTSPTLNNTDTELEIVFQINSGDVVNNDEVEIRIDNDNSGSPLPKVTVTEILNHAIVAQDVETTTETDPGTITQNNAVVAQDVESTTETDPGTITQDNVLTGQDVQSLTETDTATVTQDNALVAQDVESASETESGIMIMEDTGCDGSAQSAENTATTLHTVSLPSASAGDLLIIHFSTLAAYDSATTPTGWTRQTMTTGGLIIRAYIFTKIATGAEGSSVNITTGATCKSTHIAYRFIGYTFSTLSTQGDGTSTAPVYGTIGTPPSPAKFVDWAVYNGSASIDAYPSDFPNCRLSQEQFGNNTTTCVSNATASPPTNKTYTLSKSNQWASIGYYLLATTSTTIELGASSLSLNGRNLRSPISLYKGSLSLTGYDWNLPVLEKGFLTLTGWPLLAMDDNITLEKGTLSLRKWTNFGCYRLPKKIQRINWSGGKWPLCCEPPADLERGDFFGVVLTEDCAVGTNVMLAGGPYLVASGLNLNNFVLAQQGDYFCFRYDGAHIFMVEQEIA